jgi:hypothetical protein
MRIGISDPGIRDGRHLPSATSLLSRWERRVGSPIANCTRDIEVDDMIIENVKQG